jgi:hypothetical protein
MRVAEVQGRILDYLAQHPSAKDTLSGIAVFWVGCELEVAAAALRALVAEGEVEEVRYHEAVYFQLHKRSDGDERSP